MGCFKRASVNRFVGLADSANTTLSELPCYPQSALLDRFCNSKLVREAPSKVSQSYHSLQEDNEERILDNRPREDHPIPPISLLYDGFGVFEDVVNESVQVPGENDILESQLWGEVEAFTKRMAGFYGTEAQRREVLLAHLERIFGARRDPQAVGERIRASKIGPLQISWDGHSNGEHGATVFCLQCKNELYGITSEPSAELVSHIASSFKEQLEGEGKHRALFDGWRVPALGMTQIGKRTPHALRPHHLTGLLGSYVQFFGIVMIAQMRIVPLTPMLPLQTPASDERSRQELFLAFKAASIVIAKIQADVRKLIQKPPKAIPLEFRSFPSVTEIKKVTLSPEPISFRLVGRQDDNPFRNLYHAFTSEGDEIYVKFTERYSRDLHVFCAGRGLAPELLGFERLPGGWFAVAMKKIWNAEPLKIESLQIDTWKRDIRKLVDAFHEEGLVHGDLRPPNFIFTVAIPPKMLLIDFDWGGKAGEVCFPRGKLVKGLRGDGRYCLDQPITREDDNRVLLETFKWLDKQAKGVVGGGASTGGGPRWK